MWFFNAPRGTAFAPSRHTLRRRSSLSAETLEVRHLLAALPTITELMASGRRHAARRRRSVFGLGRTLQRWRCAARSGGLASHGRRRESRQMDVSERRLGAGTFLVVFASGQATGTYVDGGGNLHTDFSLSRRRRSFWPWSSPTRLRSRTCANVSAAVDGHFLRQGHEDARCCPIPLSIRSYARALPMPA